jgi:uncharacterized protein (DUF1697 family)
MSKDSVLGRRYVALVRVVNVGGHSCVSMERLRDLFESFGCDQVETFIQSGNVLFSASNSSVRELSESFSNRLSEALGERHEVFVFTLDELKDAYEHVPDAWSGFYQDFRCHLMFLSAVPEGDRMKGLFDRAGDDYCFAVHGTVLYYGYSVRPGVRRRTIDVERILGVVGTSRTVGVVARLIKLLSEK